METVEKKGKYKLENDENYNKISISESSGVDFEIIGVNYPVLKLNTIYSRRFVDPALMTTVYLKIIFRHIHLQPKGDFDNRIRNWGNLEIIGDYLFDDVIFSGFRPNIFSAVSTINKIVFTNCRFVKNDLDTYLMEKLCGFLI